MILISIGVLSLLIFIYYKTVGVSKAVREESASVFRHGLLPLVRFFLRHKAAFPITDLELCKLILSSSSWPDRTDPYHFIHLYHFGQPIGLIYGCGEHYKSVKRLSTKLLRQLYFYSPRNLESSVTEEVSDLVEFLDHEIKASGTDGVVLSPNRLFNPYALSIIWKIMFGCRFRTQDPKLANFLEVLTSLTAKFTVGNRSVDRIPGMLLWNRLRLILEFEKAQRTLYAVFRDYVKEKQQAEFDGELSGPRDLTDGFLRELKRTNGEDPYLTEKALLAVHMDFALAGGDTISSVMEFAILHLALNPTVQEKIYTEIDQVVGPSALPLFSHRSRMVYTQAAILEILRFGSVLSPGARVASVDNTVNGRFFKEGSVCYVKLFDIHHSNDLWADPGVFRPERFLDTSQESLVNTEKIIPFGYGRRQCLGEAAAQVALFGFLVTLVQRFRFDFPKDLPPPSLKTSSGVTRKPLDYRVRICRRS